MGDTPKVTAAPWLLKRFADGDAQRPPECGRGGANGEDHGEDGAEGDDGDAHCEAAGDAEDAARHEARDQVRERDADRHTDHDTEAREVQRGAEEDAGYLSAPAADRLHHADLGGLLRHEGVHRVGDQEDRGDQGEPGEDVHERGHLVGEHTARPVAFVTGDGQVGEGAGPDVRVEPGCAGASRSRPPRPARCRRAGTRGCSPRTTPESARTVSLVAYRMSCFG